MSEHVSIYDLYAHVLWAFQSVFEVVVQFK